MGRGAAELFFGYLSQLAHLRNLRLALFGFQTSNGVLEEVGVRIETAALRDTVVVLKERL